MRHELWNYVCPVHYIHNLSPEALFFLLFSIQGMALVFAPLRGETLRLFCQLAQQSGFIVSQHQQYDAQVMDVHLKVGGMAKALRMTPNPMIWGKHILIIWITCCLVKIDDSVLLIHALNKALPWLNTQKQATDSTHTICSLLI